ncbi:MAG: pyroglutamyl-peptidase I [Hyphomicrobiaceae bacterium]|nr:pyroglutamyl-peptidase I [Hyphomicrobiaceae bacterium]
MTAALAILLTAFGPFPGVAVNATALLVPRLAQRLRRAAESRSALLPDARFTIHTLVLPTEWQRGPDRAEAAIRRLQPGLVIHFGVSAAATGFVIERCARNVCQAHMDAAGNSPPSGSLGSAETRRANLPVTLIRERLAKAEVDAGHGLPVTTSDDAGGYLCNAVLYRTLSLPEAVRPQMAGFIHVPSALAGYGSNGRAADPGSPLDHAQFLTGGFHIISACLEGLGTSRTAA